MNIIILSVTENNVELKLQNVKLVGQAETSYGRGVQVNQGVRGVKLNLINVEIESSYYGINVCNGADVDLKIDGCTVTAWGALNLWSAKYDVLAKNSTFNGVNDKEFLYGWNNFATIVLEGDTTEKTTDHSAVIDVKLTNCTVTASSFNKNTQALIGFNSQSLAN